MKKIEYTSRKPETAETKDIRASALDNKSLSSDTRHVVKKYLFYTPNSKVNARIYLFVHYTENQRLYVIYYKIMCKLLFSSFLV